MAVRSKKYNEKIRIDLDGPQGNAFVLFGIAEKLSSICGVDSESIIQDMKSGDYLNLLKVFEENFGHIVILETSNQEYLDVFC